MEYQLQFESDATDIGLPNAQELITGRKAYWLPKLTQSLQHKRCLVAVRIGHLKYKVNLLTALIANGFEVQPGNEGGNSVICNI